MGAELAQAVEPLALGSRGMGEASPRVVDDGWGFVEVEGLGRFRDVKLWPGGGRAWDWRETGTDHQPGILCVEVTELLNHERELVILGRGRQGRLSVSPETLSLLEHMVCRSCARRRTPRWRRTTGWRGKAAESQPFSTPPASGARSTRRLRPQQGRPNRPVRSAMVQ